MSIGLISNVSQGSSLKIIDFGLSNDMTGKDMLTTQCGSMAYSAPELLSSKPYGKVCDELLSILKLR